MKENRAYQRQRVSEPARIILPDRLVSCVILDISDDGALLFIETGSTDQDVEIPDAFQLLRKAKQLIYPATIVRRTSRTIAVKLLPASKI